MSVRKTSWTVLNTCISLLDHVRRETYKSLHSDVADFILSFCMFLGLFLVRAFFNKTPQNSQGMLDPCNPFKIIPSPSNSSDISIFVLAVCSAIFREVPLRS